MSNDVKLLAWDIERVPHLGYHWGLFDQNIGLSQLVLPGETVSFAARWWGDPKSKTVFRSTFHDGKEGMLEAAWELMDEADALLSWNGAGFDTKHMQTEFILNGMGRPAPSKEVDLLRIARKHFKFASNKLEFVSQALGVGEKVKHEGFALWLKVMANDPAGWAKFRRYNKQDTDLLIDLLERMLPWVDSLPNANLFGGQGCNFCGSSNLQSRGTRVTGLTEYHRYYCNDCGGWTPGRKMIRRAAEPFAREES